MFSLFMFPLAAHANYQNVDNLTQWESNGKSLVAQKSVQTIAIDDVLTGISVAVM
jgi:hypothetical protein